MADGYFYGKVYNETIPFDDSPVIEGWNFLSAVITQDTTGTYTKMRMITFVRGGMQMSTRIFSYLYNDNVDFDMMIGAKYDKDGVALVSQFTGYVLQLSIYAQDAMTMDQLDALVDWEVNTPHLVGGTEQVKFCYFTQLYVQTWAADVCIEDTYDNTDATGMTYHFLAASYDMDYNKVTGVRRMVKNNQPLIANTYELYLGLPFPFKANETVEPHPSAQHGIYFDGDDYMQVEFNEPLIFDREFTVDMWVHFSETTVT